MGFWGDLSARHVSNEIADTEEGTMLVMRVLDLFRETVALPWSHAFNISLPGGLRERRLGHESQGLPFSLPILMPAACSIRYLCSVCHALGRELPGKEAMHCRPLKDRS